MEVEIASPVAGTVSEISVVAEQHVTTGQLLALIG
jgi:biotin carboxyl carrier protein